jgi:hypothetical protein
MDDIFGSTPSTPDPNATPPSDNAPTGIGSIIQPVVNAAENVVAAQVGDIQMIAIDSSDIAAWGYSPIEGQLQIQFTNGRIYVYDNISPMDFEMLSTSQSKGRAFWSLIRRNPVGHPFTRLV